MENKVFFVMGVSGSGKTTISEGLSERLEIPFYDSDEFHPEENIKKMSQGIPLNDEDRQPWLEAIHDFVEKELCHGSLIIATSALKESYRQVLEENLSKNQVRWIFLKGSYDLVYSRISQRKGHFMPESLLKSQFEILELPHDNVITLDVDNAPNEIVDDIVRNI